MAARLTTYVVVAIVAATLIAGLIVGAQRDDSDGPVDVIVFNARVYTGDDGRIAEAVAVRGNQILRVGSDRDVTRLRRPQTTVVDARGGSVVAGLNDADVALIEGGLRLADIDLHGAEDQDEAVARVAAWAAANPRRAWLAGGGWSPDTLRGTARAQLDAASGDRPAYLRSADGRSAWVNSAALRKAGFTRRSADPPGGGVGRDPGTREPTGLLQGAAMESVARLIPPATPQERAEALRAAIRDAHAHGVTSVQDSGAEERDFAVYDEVRRAGDLSLRVSASVAARPGTPGEDFRAIEALATQYPDDPLLKLGGVRIAVDAADAPGAASPEAAAARVDPDALNRLVRLLDERGWQITIAASGDRAARLALDAFDHAAMSNPEPGRGRRHRLGRAGPFAPADLGRLGPLGIVAVVRPAGPARGPVGGLLGAPAAGERAWPAAGTRLALGTGWPENFLRPFAAIGLAAGDGGTSGLPVGRAIDAFTSGSAYASFDEQRKGAIEPGMLADLTVLTGDVLAGPASRVASTVVALTIFDGKIVYRRDSRSTD